jgi:hypothetical protein
MAFNWIAVHGTSGKTSLGQCARMGPFSKEREVVGLVYCGAISGDWMDLYRVFRLNDRNDGQMGLVVFSGPVLDSSTYSYHRHLLALFLVPVTPVHIERTNSRKVRCGTNLGRSSIRRKRLVSECSKTLERGEYSLVHSSYQIPRHLIDGLPND